MYCPIKLASFVYHSGCKSYIVLLNEHSLWPFRWQVMYCPIKLAFFFTVQVASRRGAMQGKR